MDFLKGLLSKKLLMAVVGAAYFASIGDVNQAVAVVIGYLGVQGAVDVTKALKR